MLDLCLRLAFPAPTFLLHEPALTQPVFRFAPSPYGRMHLGNAFSALMNEKLAREAGGRLLLRIEDTDQTRARPEFVQGIFEDMDWLGIKFETPVRIQSEHMEDYRAALDRLDAMGLLYKCGCTRSQLSAAPKGKTDPDGSPLYLRTCRHHGAREGEPFALRLKMDEASARLSVPLLLNGEASAGIRPGWPFAMMPSQQSCSRHETLEHKGLSASELRRMYSARLSQQYWQDVNGLSHGLLPTSNILVHEQ